MNQNVEQNNLTQQALDSLDMRNNLSDVFGNKELAKITDYKVKMGLPDSLPRAKDYMLAHVNYPLETTRGEPQMMQFEEADKINKYLNNRRKDPKESKASSLSRTMNKAYNMSNSSFLRGY